MIEIYAKSKKRGKWEHLPNGPFPLTKQEFGEARDMFLHIFNSANEFDQKTGCWATVARDVLKNMFPYLSSFDLLMMGNPLAMKYIKIEEEK